MNGNYHSKEDSAREIPASSRDYFRILLRFKALLFTCILLLIGIKACYAQTVSLQAKNQPLEQVIKQLRAQTDYAILAPSATVAKGRAVNINLNKVTIDQALKEIFKNQPANLKYEIKGKNIIIKELPKENSDNKIDRREANFEGTVVDGTSRPLSGVTIFNKRNNIQTATDGDGYFRIPANVGDEIQFRFLGYQSQEITVGNQNKITIFLYVQQAGIDTVQINNIQTGYFSLPKERATGSFSQVNNELINRTVSTGIMSRLADVVPGLIFNKGYGGAQGLVIRGQTSIDQNTSKPLIIVDNFPFEGDINNINPNDVENITILKDAAASSIWGARAGNGVIVITTKQGKYEQKPSLNFTSNYTVGAKPDAFYQPLMSTSDFIDNEIRLFEAGVYKPGELNQGILNYPLTPLVELLIKKRDNPALENEIDATIARWRDYDVRNDYEKYLYRNLKNQQYALNLSGGSERQRYILSLGYDKNLNSEVGNGLERFTINANNTYNFFNKKLELTTGVYYTHNEINNSFSGIPTYTNFSGTPGTTMYPYAQFADANGNPLGLVNNVRTGYADAGTEKGLLDWNYRPLDEIENANKVTKGIDYRLNAGLNYKILDGLNASILYQYGRTNNNTQGLNNQNSYFSRNLINYYSQVTAPNTIKRPIPLGGILDKDDMTINVHNFRAQLNYDHSFGTKHEVNAVAGYEIRDQHTTGFRTRLYGYDDEHATSQLVNYVDRYPAYVFSGYTLQIPNLDLTTDLTDRFVSLYANSSYLYNKKYQLSGSVRFDRSNIFGVSTNNKGVPLYSIGAAWSIHKEDFFKLDWINELKLRTTYGTSGNVNRSISALTTINYGNTPDRLTGEQYATIRNAPNPDLRWEKIGTLNIGVDFSLLKNRINGSVDWYQKWGEDIISTVPYAPQTGFTQFTGNYSRTDASGMDIDLQSKNIVGLFSWDTDLQLSFITDKVTKTKLLPTISGISLLSGSSGDQILPREGMPLYSVYAYKWAGLDPNNGDPQGYVNGEISKDYVAMQNEIRADINKLNYVGTARPKVYGAFRNTFRYYQLSLSANISYRFDYYFRRQSVNYTHINIGTISHADYAKRWIKSGDEVTTDIPSITTIGSSTTREAFYQLSEILVEKGDHIRLQDIVLSYDINKQQVRSSLFNNLRLFCFLNNVGILWKAGNYKEDPDYYRAVFSPVRSISFGLSANF
ncbi:TonB-dependent receptor plug [Sphingobacterium sp. PM2-P1-29]|nr:TonB-dependent receptor plug [Sphingobacterium sp. PM2-P1-29]